jgi:hypothetical protein
MAARITKYLNKYVRRCIFQTLWDIIHVCQAIVETGSGRKLSHNGCTAGNFDIPDHGFLLLTWSTGPYLCFHTLPVPMAARITKYLNKYVCQAIVETGSGRKLSNNGCTAANFDLPDHGFSLLTSSTSPMEWSTGNGNIYSKTVNTPLDWSK